MELKTIIGLEVHVQLKTKSKMFCGCSNSYETIGDMQYANTRVCPVCMGMPGTLPVANKQAIDWTIMTGLALHSEIAKKSKFDRKHYFYPDLPKGYQISQYDQPFCKGGYLEVDISGKKKKVNLHRIHLEEDAGKLIHPKGADYSLVDLNRAGTPLMEIVTEPDINSPSEAKLFLQKLRTILRHLDVSGADMEKGHLRCDANISMAQMANGKWGEGTTPTPLLVKEGKGEVLGTPVEIKNLNSFRAVERALVYEEKRQQSIICEGGKIDKETRGWSEAKEETVPQRSKEFAHDYRYFPDPDLPPFFISQAQMSKLKAQMTEDIDAVGERYRAIGIGQADIAVLTSNFAKKRYFDKLLNQLSSDQEKVLAAKWVVNRFFAKDYIVDHYADFIKNLSETKIPQPRAMEAVQKSYQEKKTIDQVIKELGLTKIDSSDKINTIVDKIISESSLAVSDYRAGRKAALKFLVGQVMAKSKGQADPQIAERILKEKLKKN